jgi:hypothetical protein
MMAPKRLESVYEDESMGTGHFDSSKTSQNDLSPLTPGQISITMPISATLTMRDMSSTGKEAVKEIGK